MCVSDVLDSLKPGDVVEVKTYAIDWLGIVVENAGRMLTLTSLDKSATRSFSHYDIEDARLEVRK